MRVLIAALALASCYRPRVAPCQYRCAADTTCPDGLTCNLQLGGMCVSAADPTCAVTGVDSGGMDGPTEIADSIVSDVMPTSCTLFGSATQLFAPAGARPHALAFGDLDGNGTTDIVVASEVPEIGIDFAQPGMIFAYGAYSAGSDLVYQAVPFALGSGSGIAYSYVNNGASGLLEEFFSGEAPTSSLSGNAGTGSGQVPLALAAADYGAGTSLTEVVTSALASTVYTYGNSGTTRGSDSFTFQYMSSALPPAIAATMGRVDPDTDPDVVLVYKSGAQVLYDPYRASGPSGSDVTSQIVQFAEVPAAAAALVPLGSSTSLDLVIATADGLLVGYNQVDADYPFGSAFALVPHAMTPEGIVTGDFDRDGYQDVIVTDGSANLAVFEGLADGSFKEPFSVPLGSSGLELSGAIAAHDFTADGVPDLIVGFGSGLVLLTDTCGSGS